MHTHRRAATGGLRHIAFRKGLGMGSGDTDTLLVPWDLPTFSECSDYHTNLVDLTSCRFQGLLVPGFQTYFGDSSARSEKHDLKQHNQRHESKHFGGSTSSARTTWTTTWAKTKGMTANTPEALGVSVGQLSLSLLLLLLLWFLLLLSLLLLLSRTTLRRHLSSEL